MGLITSAQIYHNSHPEAGLYEIIKATNEDQNTIKKELGISPGYCAVCGEWAVSLLDDVCEQWSCRKMLRKFNHE